MAPLEPDFIELPSGPSWIKRTSGRSWPRGQRSEELQTLDSALNDYASSRAALVAAHGELVEHRRMDPTRRSHREESVLATFLEQAYDDALIRLVNVGVAVAVHRAEHSGTEQLRLMGELAKLTVRARDALRAHLKSLARPAFRRQSQTAVLLPLTHLVRQVRGPVHRR